jgi:hypothetical protein
MCNADFMVPAKALRLLSICAVLFTVAASGAEIVDNASYSGPKTTIRHALWGGEDEVSDAGKFSSTDKALLNDLAVEMQKGLRARVLLTTPTIPWPFRGTVENPVQVFGTWHRRGLVEAVTISDWGKRCARSAPIGKAGWQGDVRVLTETEVLSTQGPTNSIWENLRRRYSPFAGVLSTTLPGYGLHHTQAVLCVSFYDSAVGSDDASILMRRRKGLWVLQKVERIGGMGKRPWPHR